jgi:hypothetical protein
MERKAEKKKIEKRRKGKKRGYLAREQDRSNP